MKLLKKLDTKTVFPRLRNIFAAKVITRLSNSYVAKAFTRLSNNFAAKYKGRKYIIGLGVLIIAGSFLIVPTYRHLKVWRARQLSASALELMEDPESLRQAWEKSYTAYNLYPFDIMVTRTLARVSTTSDPSMALGFWQEAARMSGGVAEDRKGIIETALAINRLDLAREHIVELEEELAKDPEFLFLKARFLAQSNAIEKAIAVSRQILQLDGIPEKAHFFYVQLSQASSLLDERQKGITYLWSLAERIDQLGLSALRNLASYPGIDEVGTRELVRNLENHPLAELEDQLLRLELELRIPETERLNVVNKAKELFDLRKKEQLVKLSRWLNRQKLFEFTLEEVDLDSSLSRQDLFLIRLDAMSVLQQWESINKLLNRKNIPLESYIKNLFLSRVYLKFGHIRRSDIAWDRAVLGAAHDPQKLWFVANYALRMDLPVRARTPLEKLTDIPSSMRKAYETLLMLEQHAGNTVAIRNLLKRMAAIYSEEPAVINDIAYLDLLLEQNMEDALADARKMVDRNPLLLSHRITLAFGFLRTDDPKSALSVFDELTIDWRTVQSRWRLVIAAVLEANDFRDDVKKILLGLDPQNLLPEETIILEELANN